MKGQWSGRFQGTNEGWVNLNIDEKISSYSGVAYFFDDNGQMPAVVVHFEIAKSDLINDSGLCKSSWINPLQPGNFTEVSWDSVKEFYPNASFPKTIEIKFKYSNCSLNVSAKTDIETEVVGVLNRSELSQPSSLSAKKMTWSEYKSFVLSNEHECVYRGQSEPWKLQTSFHRRGRYDLTRYQQEDIPQLHRSLSARTRHVFNLSNAQENGAFLNLVQHHGYPTPLLDWTHSPYVVRELKLMGLTAGSLFPGLDGTCEELKEKMFD